jgi:hypothetical protein
MEKHTQPAGRGQAASSFVALPMTVIDDERLDRVCLLILTAVLSYDWGNGCHASIAKICTRARCKRSAAITAISQLEAFGYLRVERRQAQGKTNRIFVTGAARLPKSPTRLSSGTRTKGVHFLDGGHLTAEQGVSDLTTAPRTVAGRKVDPPRKDPKQHQQAMTSDAVVSQGRESVVSDDAIHTERTFSSQVDDEVEVGESLHRSHPNDAESQSTAFERLIREGVDRAAARRLARVRTPLEIDAASKIARHRARTNPAGLLIYLLGLRGNEVERITEDVRLAVAVESARRRTLQYQIAETTHTAEEADERNSRWFKAFPDDARAHIMQSAGDDPALFASLVEARAGAEAREKLIRDFCLPGVTADSSLS